MHDLPISKPPQSGDPHNYEGKMIHVGTPGIFHKPADSFYRTTVCGRDGSDCRATDHKLEAYQPCVVCWPDTGPPAPGEGDHLPNPEIGMEC